MRRRSSCLALAVLAPGCLESPPSDGVGPDHVTCDDDRACSFGEQAECLCARCVHADAECDPSGRRFTTSAGPGGPCVPAPLQVAVGNYHACATWSDGRASCWGSDCEGQIGDQPSEECDGRLLRPVPTLVRASAGGPSLDRISRIATGAVSTCALRDDGTVWCWGMNLFGVLGTTEIEENTIGFEPRPVLTAELATLKGIREIGVGAAHGCGIDGDPFFGGDLWCWGNHDGALGIDDWPSDGEPRLAQPAATDGEIMAMSAGAEHTCVAAGEAGALLCFGRNGYGQLGRGSPGDGTTQPTAQKVLRVEDDVPLTGGTAVAGGSNFTCAAIASPPSVRCWGENRQHALGDDLTPTDPDGTTAWAARESVLDAAGGGGAVALDAGDSFACALLANDEVRCWGGNTFGQIAADPETVPHAPPRLVLTDARSLAVGFTSACAITNDSRVLCWGENSAGQIGDGTTTDRAAPTEVRDLCPEMPE